MKEKEVHSITIHYTGSVEALEKLLFKLATSKPLDIELKIDGDFKNIFDITYTNKGERINERVKALTHFMAQQLAYIKGDGLLKCEYVHRLGDLEYLH